MALAPTTAANRQGPQADVVYSRTSQGNSLDGRVIVQSAMTHQLDRPDIVRELVCPIFHQDGQPNENTTSASFKANIEISRLSARQALDTTLSPENDPEYRRILT